ncbi:MAG: methionine adenosyltransferase [Candidatus Peregrinibacteria bacterium]
MSKNFLFTSESVTEGHPDKMCDQVSDAVLDAVLAKDPNGRVAVECATKTGLLFLFGELSTSTYVDFQSIARGVVERIGYTNSEMGFDAHGCSVMSAIEEQSPEIAHAVLDQAELGAGDQGMMFGFACQETEDLMPLPIALAHKLSARLAHIRHEGLAHGLRPDGKTQVTVQYENGKPKRVHTVVVSTQHDPHVSQKMVQEIVHDLVITPILGDLIDTETIFHINPSGSFVVGGPQGDSGLTGRKIIVDTYGGYAPHGGGAFSGKDPSKVDRSGAYMARYIAKNIVAAGLAEKCQIEVSYAIGMAEPISLLVETFGTGKLSDEELEKLVRKTFPLKPGEMIAALDLRKPIYQRTACYGHFGRPEFPWEQIMKGGILGA